MSAMMMLAVQLRAVQLRAVQRPAYQTQHRRPSGMLLTRGTPMQVWHEAQTSPATHSPPASQAPQLQEPRSAPGGFGSPPMTSRGGPQASPALPEAPQSDKGPSRLGQHLPPHLSLHSKHAGRLLPATPASSPARSGPPPGFGPSLAFGSGFRQPGAAPRPSVLCPASSGGSSSSQGGEDGGESSAAEPAAASPSPSSSSSSLASSQLQQGLSSREDESSSGSDPGSDSNPEDGGWHCDPTVAALQLHGCMSDLSQQVVPLTACLRNLLPCAAALHDSAVHADGRHRGRASSAESSSADEDDDSDDDEAYVTAPTSIRPSCDGGAEDPGQQADLEAGRPRTPVFHLQPSFFGRPPLAEADGSQPLGSSRSD